MIGIVILNYKTWEMTLKCVESIKNNDKTEMKIYIIDNHSPNNSFERLNDCYCNDDMVDVILTESNLGFAKGNNVGINRCKDDGIKYAIITNNDVLFQEDAINSMYAFIVNNSNAVIVGPKILDIHNHLSTSCFLGKQKILQYLDITSKKQLLLDEMNDTKAAKVYSVSGCCIMVDIDKFDLMGAFDEGTFLYGEEGILAAQAEKSEFDIYFLPQARVIHNHGTTTGNANLFIEGEMLKSGLYYWKKYRNDSNWDVTLIFVFLFSKTILKILIGKITRSGFLSYVKNAFYNYGKSLQFRIEG